MSAPFDWEKFKQAACEQEEASGGGGGVLIPDWMTMEDLKRAYLVEVGLDAEGEVTVRNTGKPFLQPAAAVEENTLPLTPTAAQTWCDERSLRAVPYLYPEQWTGGAPLPARSGYDVSGWRHFKNGASVRIAATGRTLVEAVERAREKWMRAEADAKP
jgi:hypothetical protein